MNQPTNEQEKLRPFDLEAANELVKNSEQLDYRKLLQGVDVLYLGERHVDYSIASHLQSQVKTLKRSGVTTFALEFSPEDQPILDAISNGNLSEMDKLSFSLGFGSGDVEKNKRELVKALVKQGLFEKGMQLLAVADWSNSSSGNSNPYTAESELKAAAIIAEKAKAGKVVVLIGAEHARYAKGDFRYPFVRSTDLLKENGANVKTAYFIGGMPLPFDDDKTDEFRFRKATENQGKRSQAFYLDAARLSFPPSLKYDGLIHIPEVPFKSAQKKP